jgi:hypothetical protein
MEFSTKDKSSTSFIAERVLLIVERVSVFLVSVASIVDLVS